MAKRGRPTDGFYVLVASAARVLVTRGQPSAQAIATAEEVCRTRYREGVKRADGTVEPWPKRLDVETVRRTMRRISAGERLDVKFPIDMTLQLLAASHPESEPLSDKAAEALSAAKLSLRATRKAITEALKARKTKR